MCGVSESVALSSSQRNHLRRDQSSYPLSVTIVFDAEASVKVQLYSNSLGVSLQVCGAAWTDAASLASPEGKNSGISELGCDQSRGRP